MIDTGTGDVPWLLGVLFLPVLFVLIVFAVIYALIGATVMITVAALLGNLRNEDIKSLATFWNEMSFR